MKQNKSLSLYLILLASAVLGGCVKEEYGPESGRPSDQICFSTSLKVDGSGVMTKSQGVHLMMESEDWVLEGETPETRVAPTTSLSGVAGIIGYIDSGTSPADGLDDVSFTFENDVLKATGTPIPWSRVSGASTALHVFSYAPYSAVHGSPAATLNKASATPSLSYTVPDAVGSQIDLIAAKADVAKASFGTSVPLSFDHILTAVRFKVDFACKVKSLTINGVYKTGTYTFGSGWSGQGTAQNYAFGSELFTAEGTDFDANDFLTDGANTLMLLPQTAPGDATVVLEYWDTSASDWATLTASIAGHSWLPGKRVTYTISKTGVSYIYFDLAAGPVTIIPNATGFSGTKYVYSGSVYINGNGTKATVTGDHLASNKYYIYQSTETNRNTTGWSGAIGSTMTVPSYSGVRSPDGTQTWGEFITNNKHSEDVIGVWKLDYDYNTSGTYRGISHHPVYDANRTGTSNCILFRSGVTGQALTIDVTIDNLWCSYEGWKHSAEAIGTADVSASNTTGYYAQFFVNGAHGSTGEMGGTIQVDLRLKGDNFFQSILFDTRKVNDYFHLTSADGDGSEKGSLTVTPNYNRTSTTTSSFVFDASQTLGSFYSVQTRTKTHYGLGFKGGTLYVATPLYYRDSDASYTAQCFGGGANSHIQMSISGGAVTAVSHSTASAIGGGGGYTYIGGDGIVNISGGKVYAYQYGAAGRTKNYAVPGTAIGGGSSFCGVANSGQVSISGDAYVYAESVGGVAIGGGSSGGCTGGFANIQLSGNPTVIAKSVPGSIKDFWGGINYSVTYGTAIGGGSGGDEVNKAVYPEYGTTAADLAHGGKATVNISGGRLYTASIGGGKNGKASDSEGGAARNLGSAEIDITGGDVQGQFIMQAGAATAPYFTMNGGTIDNRNLLTSEGYYKVRDNGGAVFIGGGTNPGTFTMTGGTIVNSSATLGGAVYQEGGTVSMSGGTINSCSATNGGALYVSGGTVNLTGGIMRNCTSTTDGGAVYIAGGTVTISGSTSVDHCISGSDGGGLYVTGGNVTINNGTISGNRSANASGGGVFVNNGNFSMSAGTISGNYAATNGGGVSVSSESGSLTVNITGGNITGNSSGQDGGGLSVVPASDYPATVNLGVNNQGLTNPNISLNTATRSGGGVYASGADAAINIYSGKVLDNTVSAIVDNPDVANDGGLVTLYAGDVTHVVVTYHMNDGANPEVTSTQLIVTSVRSILTAPSWTLSGYTFGGWYPNPACTGDVSYSSGDEVNLSTSLHLYAKWTQN